MPTNINIISDHDLQYKRRFANLPGVKSNMHGICSNPWNFVTVDMNGRIFLCTCEGWLPYPVGHVMDFSSFDKIWNSITAKEIQESILNKEYKYCATNLCYYQDSPDQGLEKRIIDLNLNIDPSCNISCPSCRERMIFIKDRNILSEKLKWVEQVNSWVQKTDRMVRISTAGGDPFASILYKRIFKIFANNPRVKFVINTNGLLLKKRFNLLQDIINRSEFSISIDAVTKETYEQVRRGSRWETLLENLEFVKPYNVRANFVIQKKNYKEILPFIDFCKEYNLTPGFSLLEDWGTWHNFEEQCVHLSTSPEQQELKEIIKQAKIDYLKL